MSVVWSAILTSVGFLLSITPKFLLKAFTAGVARLAYIVNVRHRRIAEVNLDFAFNGEIGKERKKEIIINAYENLLKNVLGILIDNRISAQELLSKSEFAGSEIIEELKAQDEKIVFITAHYGNWENMASASAARFELNITVVGRELDLSFVNDTVKKSRERFGVELISKHGAMRRLVKSLKDAKAAGILVDQNTADDEGLIVNFFGKEARQTPVASILARRFDAAIVPAFCEYTGFDSYKISFAAPIYCAKTDDVDKDILECTQAQSDAIEAQIRKNPDVWFWFHQRWKNRYEEIYK